MSKTEVCSNQNTFCNKKVLSQLWHFLQFRGVTIDGRPAGALPSYNPPASARASVSKGKYSMSMPEIQLYLDLSDCKQL